MHNEYYTHTSHLYILEASSTAAKPTPPDAPVTKTVILKYKQYSSKYNKPWKLV